MRLAVHNRRVYHVCMKSYTRRVEIHDSSKDPTDDPARLLDRLCDVLLMADDPHAAIRTICFCPPSSPLPSWSGTIPGQITNQARPGSVAEVRARDVSIVLDAWQMVKLGDATSVRETRDMNPQGSMFDIWGDLMVAAQLAFLYRQQNFPVAMEDLCRCDTLLAQASLLQNVCPSVS